MCFISIALISWTLNCWAQRSRGEGDCSASDQWDGHTQTNTQAPRTGIYSVVEDSKTIPFFPRLCFLNTLPQLNSFCFGAKDFNFVDFRSRHSPGPRLRRWAGDVGARASWPLTLYTQGTSPPACISTRPVPTVSPNTTPVPSTFRITRWKTGR